MLKKIATVLCCAFALSAFSRAPIANINDLQQLVPAVKKDVAAFGAKHVLVVFDDDNTLLTIPGLGGVAWWDWQMQLLQDHSQSPDLMAKNFKALLALQTKLFSEHRMQLTKPDVASVVATIQHLHPYVIIATARGASMAPETRWQLHAHQIYMRKNALPSGPQFAKAYIPCQQTAWAKGKHFRPVAYWHGIYYLSGQHKGLMLGCLLHKTNLSIKAIVFVDDAIKNVNSVDDFFSTQPMQVNVFHYTRMRHNVYNFLHSKGRQQQALLEFEHGEGHCFS